MAVLETIRVKFGVLITVLIALALLSFIVDFNSLSSVIDSSSSKYTVGKINGKKISYKDFQEQVEYQTRIAEMLGGNAASSEQGQQQIRDAAWQHFVDQNLFFKSAAAAGIEVGQAEMIDLAGGEMVSPVLAYNPMFRGADGSFSKEAFTEFISKLGEDTSGNARLYWDFLQNQISTQQYYLKYGSLFTAGNMSNSLVLQNALEGNNVSASMESVMVPYPYEKDSTIVVSSADVHKYYNAHKKDYRQKASRDIEYALFEVVPSEDDYAAAKKAVDDVYEEFVAAENVKNFIMRNSERQFDTYWYKAGELNTISTEVNNFVFNGKAAVSPVMKVDDNYMAVRVLDTKAIPDSVFVRHILIQNNDSLADSLLTVVKANESKFAEMALLYSADKNPNVAPGEIGWMTQTYMIPGMESVMTAAVNKPYLIETRYGKHIVEVTRRTNPIAKKQIAILQKAAVPSKSTMNEYYSKANTLATKAGGKFEKLQEAAKELNIYLMPTKVYEGTADYGSARKAKEVTRWVFDAKKGAVSNVITVNQNYLFVVGVKDTHKEGYASVGEVKAGIEATLYQRQLADKFAKEIADKIKDCTTMQEVGEVLGQTPTKSDDVTFASLNSRDNEPAVLGAVAGAEQGKVTGPVKGVMGVYVLAVTDRTTGSHYTEDDAKAFADQMNQYSAQMLLPVMLDSSNSIDNRERFY